MSSADPRTIYNGGQGAVFASFDIESGVSFASDEDKPVAMTGNNEVSDGADNEALAGKLIAVSKDATEAFVQIGGIVTGLAYGGTAPEVGFAVQMQAAHTVDKGATAFIARGMCINVDTTAVTCDVFL